MRHRRSAEAAELDSSPTVAALSSATQADARCAARAQAVRRDVQPSRRAAVALHAARSPPRVMPSRLAHSGPPNTADKLRSGARVHLAGAGMRRHLHPATVPPRASSASSACSAAAHATDSALDSRTRCSATSTPRSRITRRTRRVRDSTPTAAAVRDRTACTIVEPQRTHADDVLARHEPLRRDARSTARRRDRIAQHPARARHAGPARRTATAAVADASDTARRSTPCCQRHAVTRCARVRHVLDAAVGLACVRRTARRRG